MRSSRLSLDAPSSSSSSSSSTSFSSTSSIFSPLSSSLDTTSSSSISLSSTHHPLLITTNGLQGQRNGIGSPSSTNRLPLKLGWPTTVFKSPGLNQVIEESNKARELRRSSSMSSTSPTNSSFSASLISSEIAKALASASLRDTHSSVFETFTKEHEHVTEGATIRTSVLESLMNIKYEYEEEGGDNLKDNEKVTTQASNAKTNTINSKQLWQSNNVVGTPTSRIDNKTVKGEDDGNEKEEEEGEYNNSNSSVESLRAELKATQAVLRTLRSENSELRFAKSPSATPLKSAPAPSPMPPPPPPQPTEEQEHYAEALLAQAEAAKALSLANASSALRRAALIAKSQYIERTSSGINSAVELSLEAIKILADDGNVSNN